MKLFDMFKTKKESPERLSSSENHAVTRRSAVERHKKRIDNLNCELEQLFNELELTESNFDMVRNEREKRSDAIIRRIALIKYEIDVREELVKWLS